jgi:hypothetical protein
MCKLIEFIPFRLGSANPSKSSIMRLLRTATLFFIPFLFAIYPMIWAQGVIHDFEMSLLTQVDKQARSGTIIRDLDDHIKLHEDEMAKKRDVTFFLKLWVLDAVNAPIDINLAGEIAALKVSRDLAIKTIVSTVQPGYINILRIMLEFLSTISLLYIWFISAKFYLYLLFRLAPSCGVPVVYSFSPSAK